MGSITALGKAMTEQATKMFNDARLAESSGDFASAAIQYGDAANILLDVGNVSQAKQYAEYAASLSQTHQLEDAEGSALALLGSIAMRMSDVSNARKYFDGALKLVASNSPANNRLQYDLAWAAFVEHDFDSAEGILEKLKNQDLVAELQAQVEHLQGWIVIRQSDYGQARTLFTNGLMSWAAANHKEGKTMAHLALAIVDVLEKASVTSLQAIAEQCEQISDPDNIETTSRRLIGLADQLLVLEKPNLAGYLTQTGLSFSKRHKLVADEASHLEILGCCEEILGSHTKASAYHEEALIRWQMAAMSGNVQNAVLWAREEIAKL